MIIEKGSEGDYVSVWQRIVGTPVDGKFGPGTDRAVRAWQGARGVEPDGVVGPLTRAALVPGDLIRPHEGFRARPYDDHDGTTIALVNGVWRRPDGSLPRGYPTIGWGRRLWTDRDFRPSPASTETITHCTRAEGDDWFEKDLARTRMPAVRRTNLTEAGQICAAASVAYNAGTGALAELAKDWSQWPTFRVKSRGVVVHGLVKRRAEEWALFSGA